MDRSTRMAALDAELEAALTPVMDDLTSARAMSPEFEDLE